MPGLVHPGETVDFSVNLIAPGAEGGYKGYWLLRNSEGVLFGIGVNANVAFWVEIEVLQEEEEEEEGPVILELAPIELFPLFVSSGSGQSLPIGGCFDLDTASMVGCGSGADLRYNAELRMEGFPPVMTAVFEVDPRNGARFDYFGVDTPTGSECQAAGLSGATFEVQSKVYCYQTDGGKYGYLRITGASMVNLTFDWATYTFP
jgi:hypothetical protein